MPTEFNDIITIQSILSVWGLGGADEFRWYSGSATIYGGDTNEQYDTNVYGAKTGGDRLYVMSNTDISVRFTSTENGTVRTAGDELTFTGIERLHLGDGNDTIKASDAPIDRYGLSVWANGGDDRITGGEGDDFIDPGAGDDVVRAGGGLDFIEASRGNDRIYGGAGDDNIRWGRGDPGEVVGDDKLFGGAGMDLVNVWIKDGWLNSNGVEVEITKVVPSTSIYDAAMSGSSFTNVGGARSTLQFRGFEQGWTHEGRDVVSGAGAKVEGTLGMRWNTRNGDDVLIGTSANDTLEGGGGSDTITGGRGNDLISANTNWWAPENAPGDGVRDVLVFRQGDGRDRVAAFDEGIDRLDIGGRSYQLRETAAGTELDFGGGDSILLLGVFDYS